MLFGLLLTLAALAGELKVHVLDVGQGDAILIEAPGDKNVLIDAGTGKSGVTDQLKRMGIDSLNLAVSTHPHADHIGGMAEVLKTLDVGMYMDNGMSHTTMTYSRTMQALEKREVQYRAAVAGRTINVGPEVKLTILHPRQTQLRGTRSDLNSNSVVVRLDHGRVCMLLTGDAEDPTERDLMNRGLSQCDVLKVAHHGSEHSTSDLFLRAVKPQVALISSGNGNRYGHPDPHALARLESAGVKVHRTDLEGTLTVTSNGKKFSVVGSKKAPDPAPSKPDVATVTPQAEPTPTPPPPASGEAVNINTASAAALDTLPGIGPSKAASIVAYRSQNGPFSSCSDLQKVYGIGAKTVTGLSNRCTTSGEKTP
jgi:competence protein ComEC